MTYHARLNWIMSLTIIALIIFVYFYQPQSSVATEYPLTSISADAVRHLRIVTPQQEMVLERNAEQWRLISPIHALVDAEKVEKVLALLRAKSLHRFQREEDLGRFGLNHPNLRLVINDEYFDFGGFAPTTHQQYVSTKYYVYLLPARYALAVPMFAQDLIAHHPSGSGLESP
ncbi:MAG: DUF4340 domain-containing protein [Nitrosomonas sp.]|nr:MAG: DUF4340 domain-containing protein [Nitrosomonas sp.]